jgi:hypothetical protein
MLHAPLKWTRRDAELLLLTPQLSTWRVMGFGGGRAELSETS